MLETLDSKSKLKLSIAEELGVVDSGARSLRPKNGLCYGPVPDRNGQLAWAVGSYSPLADARD